MRSFQVIILAMFVASGPGYSFQTKPARTLSKSQITKHAVFDANRISCIMMNNGQYVSHTVTGNSGMEWPEGSSKLIDFASGIWVAGIARSDGYISTAAAEYAVEFQPGKILPSGQPDNPELPKYRWHKITIAESKRPGADYLDWPIEDGAPVDESGKPLLIGDQTLWCVFNDAEASEHGRVFGTRPMGVEVQMTVWGYDKPNIPGDMMFVKAKMIHKGTETFDSTFFAIWNDPDLGGAGDDYVGCDSALSLAYCWNGDDYDDAYGLAPPAIGRVLLQGPISASPGDTANVFGRHVPGFRNLPLHAFLRLIKPPYPNPDPGSAMDVFLALDGRFQDGSTFANPITSEPTKFHFSGDPESDSGWTEQRPAFNQPGDRRMLMSTGPFTFSPGDTQEVVFAVIIARGTTNLNSVTRLKGFSSVIRQAYDAGYFFPIPTAPPIGKKPAQFGLRQNYPNPFNLSTRIPFSVKREGRIMLEICDLIGRRVRILKNEVMQPGDYETEWNGLNDEGNAVNSGPYFVRIATNGGVSTIKMMVVK